MSRKRRSRVTRRLFAFQILRGVLAHRAGVSWFSLFVLDFHTRSIFACSTWLRGIAGTKGRFVDVLF